MPFATLAVTANPSRKTPMQVRTEVETMLRAGKPFGQIEDRIESMHINEEAKSALWLLAWSEQRTDSCRHILEEDRAEALPPG
jgi:hypothetical protein